ncbi:ejaculatory bulb-specific protein 3-like [Pieris napi]|uniref:ejaculatory bulb-specific protein 3-like n=1 Tax=Pieris napi TaxID=78633 RepID=UPI001FB97BE9|nr:ejaculatory bulb-specific protein 3-like [Pieris napi]
MKLFIILSALVAMTIAEDIVYFTTDNDYLDIDTAMKDPTLVKGFIDCFVDRAPCDPLSQSYKKNMPEAVPTACHRCNDPQKHLWNRFLTALKESYPQYYWDYEEKYDPNHIYLPLLEKAVAEY